jgi:putative nucleotidyltransferase with HDIG domain
VDEVEKKTAELNKALELLTQASDDTLEALGSGLDLKDMETADHSRRVTAYTISIAKTVPVPLHYLEVLARAAFLHDIGKMAIPDKILRSGPLDDSEKQIMRTHSTTCSHAFRSSGRPPRSSSPTMNSSMVRAIHVACAANRFPWGRASCSSRIRSIPC